MSIHKETTGQGLHEPSQFRVENTTGTDIPKLTAVKRTGGYGIFVQVTPVTDTADITWGVSMDIITDGEDGFIARNGNFGGLDTSAWTVGTSLYKTATGEITSTAAGDSVGLVLVQDATAGRILFTLGEGSGGGGGGAVDSVFGRAGVVSANANDYTWAQVDKTTSDLADLTTKSHTSLDDIGTNSHAQIDTHLASTSNPHTVTASDVGLGNVTNESKATMFTAPAFTGNSSFAGNGSPVLGHVPTGTDGLGNWTWQAPSGGGGAVDSVYGRTGAVIANANDYTWAQINKTVSNIADITTKSHTSLTDIGTKSHATLDSEVGANTTHSGLTTGNPHSVSASDVGLGNVTNESKATMFTAPTLTGASIFSGNGTPAAGKVPTGTDGTGAWTWEAAGGAFSTTSNVTSNSVGTLGTDDFVFGSDQLDDDADATHDSRFLFDKSKSFFAAGQATSVEFDDSNRGIGSAVFGSSSLVVGNYCFAAGLSINVTSTANSSIAFGQYTTQRGDQSGSFGSYNEVTAASYNGWVIGHGGKVSGDSSVLFSMSAYTGYNQNILTQSNAFVVMEADVGIGTLTPDTNASLTVAEAIKLASYTVATLPTVVTGGLIYVSDETGGATTAFGDGTNWRRTSDRAIVS